MGRPPSSSLETTKEPRSRPWLAFAGLGLIAIYVVAFVVRNSGKVSLDFIFFSARVGLIWLLLLGFALGVAGGALASQLYRRRRGHRAG
jgi:uncharacterized integral membrane protein